MRGEAQLKQCKLGRALGELVQKIIGAKFGGEVGWIWLEGATRVERAAGIPFRASATRNLIDCIYVGLDTFAWIYTVPKSTTVCKVPYLSSRHAVIDTRCYPPGPCLPVSKRI
jgi:hypothetical protein